MEELLQTPIAERISPGLIIEALLLAHRGGRDFLKKSGPSLLLWRKLLSIHWDECN